MRQHVRDEDLPVDPAGAHQDQTVWVVYGQTESGDPWMVVFDKEPTKEQIWAHIDSVEWLKEEHEAECIHGWAVSAEAVVELP